MVRGPMLQMWLRSPRQPRPMPRVWDTRRKESWGDGMRLRLLNLAAAVSLTLLVVAVVLWVRSYWRLDILANPHSSVPHGQLRTQLFGWSYRGEGCIMIVRQTDDYYGDHPWRVFSGNEADYANEWLRLVLTGAPGTWHGLLGFSFGGEASQDGGYYRFLRVPLWSVACALAVLPVFTIGRYVRQRRRSRRGCVALHAATISAPPPTAAPSAARLPYAQRTRRSEARLN